MNQIIKLLTSFQKFQDESGTDNLNDFARWLIHVEHSESLPEIKDEEVRNAGIDIQISYLLGKLASYIDVWVKLSFQDIPLVSISDFAIIKTVEELKKPTKKEVLDQVIIEQSTGIEAIKRLTKKGIFKEEVDEKDRRQKRIQFTKEGLELCKVLDQKMLALAGLLTGDISDEEKRSILPPLQKLNHFHNELYSRSDKSEIKKKFDI